MERELVRLSKFLSHILRHRPQRIGLTLDDAGWAEVDELLTKANEAGRSVSREQLERVVAESDKQRFSLSADGRRIRANQGHSIDVDLGLEPQVPPELLYHGTATRFLDSIRREGLHPRKRRHVHLSRDVATATTVGQRHGRPVVLVVEAGRMYRAGLELYLSANNVWLTEQVPPEYLRFPD